MLQEIYICNFVLIEELRIQFSDSINILSGETGAGKSIIVDALGLLMGDRLNNDFIRDSERRTFVEGVFDVSHNIDAGNFLSEQGLALDEDEGGTLILSREINPGGRSISRINGRTVTLSVLKVLSGFLVDMHLQNDRQSILKPANYLDYVDSFAEDINDLPMDVASAFNMMMDTQKRWEDLIANKQNRLQRIDFLDYQIKEIEAQGLQLGEDDELLQLQERIKNAGKLLEGSRRITGLLYNAEATASACDQISAAIDIARSLREDRFLAGLIEPLENMYYSLQDLSANLVDFADKLDFEPDQLEEVENRLYMLNKLKGKYGDTINDILEYVEKARAERHELEGIEERQHEIEIDLEEQQSRYMELASLLSQKRRRAAGLLEERISRELLELNMPDIQFQVLIEKKSAPGINGMDKVDFLFSPNPGEEMKPVTRVASGGEISRFILALKTALADVYPIPTLIFDEIDVGLGGSALNSVARKLAELSRGHQLILVTHAPQIACYGLNHIVIEKYVEDDKTYTRANRLEEDARILEIARMLDGENFSPLTLEHAREMIVMANMVRPMPNKNI